MYRQLHILTLFMFLLLVTPLILAEPYEERTYIYTIEINSLYDPTMYFSTYLTATSEEDSLYKLAEMYLLYFNIELFIPVQQQNFSRDGISVPQDNDDEEGISLINPIVRFQGVIDNQ